MKKRHSEEQIIKAIKRHKSGVKVGGISREPVGQLTSVSITGHQAVRFLDRVAEQQLCPKVLCVITCQSLGVTPCFSGCSK